MEIEVDENTLRNERQELDDDFDIEIAIEKEFGWLDNSGIYFMELKEFEK